MISHEFLEDSIEDSMVRTSVRTFSEGFLFWEIVI